MTQLVTSPHLEPAKPTASTFHISGKEGACPLILTLLSN